MIMAQVLTGEWSSPWEGVILFAPSPDFSSAYTYGRQDLLLYSSRAFTHEKEIVVVEITTITIF